MADLLKRQQRQIQELLRERAQVRDQLKEANDKKIQAESDITEIRSELEKLQKVEEKNGALRQANSLLRQVVTRQVERITNMRKDNPPSLRRRLHDRGEELGKERQKTKNLQEQINRFQKQIEYYQSNEKLEGIKSA